MNYDEIFNKPIEEMTDEEIISRAKQLRGQHKLPNMEGRAVATTKKKSTKTPTKAQTNMDDFFAQTMAKMKKDDK